MFNSLVPSDSNMVSWSLDNIDPCNGLLLHGTMMTNYQKFQTFIQENAFENVCRMKAFLFWLNVLIYRGLVMPYGNKDLSQHYLR